MTEEIKETGFKPASEYEVPVWDKQMVRRFQDYFLGLDIALAKFETLKKDGGFKFSFEAYGFKFHAESQPVTQVETKPVSTTPKKVESAPPATGTKASKETVIAILKKSDLSPDNVVITEHPQGVELYVKPTKQLGDLWRDYDDILKPIGAVWVRWDGNNQATTGRWVIRIT